MTPVQFEQANCVIAKDQPEYLPLPAFADRESDEGVVVSCWQLTWRERFQLLMSGRFFISQFTFKNPVQPQFPSVEFPEFL